VPAELPVHINRDGLHSLEVPTSFEAEGSFDVRLINHGESVHVHVHLEDVLAEAGSIDATNHYVKGDSDRLVRIDVGDGVRGLGKLKVAAGYGAQTRYIDVAFAEPEDDAGSVRVDESLARPQPAPESEAAVLDNSVILLVALAVLALVVAGLAVVFIEETTVALAALGLVAATAVAVYVTVLAE
jgi:hypothetical protein